VLLLPSPKQHAHVLTRFSMCRDRMDNCRPPVHMAARSPPFSSAHMPLHPLHPAVPLPVSSSSPLLHRCAVMCQQL
jgi:hypothetical protein